MCQMPKKRHWSLSLRVFWEDSWFKNTLVSRLERIVQLLLCLLQLIFTPKLPRTSCQSQPSSTTRSILETSQKSFKDYFWLNQFRFKIMTALQDFGSMKQQECSLIGFVRLRIRNISKTWSSRFLIKSSKLNGPQKKSYLVTDVQQITSSLSFLKLIPITDSTKWLKRNLSYLASFKTNWWITTLVQATRWTSSSLMTLLDTSWVFLESWCNPEAIQCWSVYQVQANNH